MQLVLEPRHPAPQPRAASLAPGARFSRVWGLLGQALGRQAARPRGRFL